MSKFLYIYSAGTYPETPEEGEKVMAAWRSWMGSLGTKLVDGGSALGDKKQLGGAKKSDINGYSIVEADDLEGACALCEDHPHLAAGGHIEVAACLDM